MAKISVYYEEHAESGDLVPKWLNITFRRGELQWDKQRFYVSLESPFKRMTAEDYFPDVMSITITQGDLIRHPEEPIKFGIFIPHVIQRLEQSRDGADFEYEDIEQFILQIADIAEIMEMDVIPFYDWR